MGPCQFTRQWWLKPHQKYQNISRLTSFVAWIPCIVISFFLGRLNIHSLLDIASCKLHSSVMHVPIKIWPPSYTAAVWWQGRPWYHLKCQDEKVPGHWHNTPQRPELSCLVSTCFNSFETRLWKLWNSWNPLKTLMSCDLTAEGKNPERRPFVLVG